MTSRFVAQAGEGAAGGAAGEQAGGGGDDAQRGRQAEGAAPERRRGDESAQEQHQDRGQSAQPQTEVSSRRSRSVRAAADRGQSAQPQTFREAAVYNIIFFVCKST